MRVRELIRELRQFPDDWKVSLESYEEELCNSGKYVKHSLIGVEMKMLKSMLYSDSLKLEA